MDSINEQAIKIIAFVKMSMYKNLMAHERWAAIPSKKITSKLKKKINCKYRACFKLGFETLCLVFTLAFNLRSTFASPSKTTRLYIHKCNPAKGHQLTSTNYFIGNEWFSHSAITNKKNIATVTVGKYSTRIHPLFFSQQYHPSNAWNSFLLSLLYCIPLSVKVI